MAGGQGQQAFVLGWSLTAVQAVSSYAKPSGEWTDGHSRQRYAASNFNMSAKKYYRRKMRVQSYGIAHGVFRVSGILRLTSQSPPLRFLTKSPAPKTYKEGGCSQSVLHLPPPFSPSLLCTRLLSCSLRCSAISVFLLPLACPCCAVRFVPYPRLVRF